MQLTAVPMIQANGDPYPSYMVGPGMIDVAASIARLLNVDGPDRDDEEEEINPLEACEAPGLKILDDPRGDIFALVDGAPENPAVPFYDLRSLSIVQPFVENPADYRIEFKLKVESLIVLPNGQWPVNFCSPAFECSNPDTNTKPYGADNKYFTVRMSTLPADGGAPESPVFQILQPTASGNTAASRTVIPAHPDSTYDFDGTITLVANATDIGLSVDGAGTEALSAFQSRLTPAATTPDNMPNELAGKGKYTALSLDRCDPLVLNNTAPVAELTVPTVLMQDEPASFSGANSTDADGNPLSYTFDFGDGTVVGPQSAAEATHTYAEGGNFTVTLTVSDGIAESTASAEVAVAVQEQDVDSDGDGILDKDEAEGCVDDPDPTCGDGQTDNGTLASALSCALADAQNDPYTFDCTASSSYLEGGTVNAPQYKLVAGDGSETAYQASASFTHSYAAAGEYRAFVVARDANGNSAVSDAVVNEVVITISVTDDGANAARLKVDQATGPAPLTVTFDAGSSTVATGYHITGYAWDFDGDGSTDFQSSTPVVQHVYTSAGEYTPSVTVSYSNEAGDDTPTSVAKASVAATAPGTPTPPVQQSAGGGSLGWLVLLPLFGGALIRRRRVA